MNRLAEQDAAELRTDTDSSTPVVELHRFFREGFTASNVAEPLVSWDATADASEVAARMDVWAFDAAGVRIDGAVAGWVLREDLETGRVVDHLRSFFGEELISGRAPLQQVIQRLGSEPRLFVTAFGGVGGVITPADLQKAPVRMWLFGLITLVEESFTGMIREQFADGSWQNLLSVRRVELAQRLHDERRRRNQSLDLIDCIQFGDKGTIIFKDQAVRERMGFRSRARAKQVMKNLESLRNQLAHSQDIVAGNLSTIIELARAMDRVLRIIS